MNFKKFLIVAIMFGLVKLCHGAPVQAIKDMSIQLPPSTANQVSVYPCFSCPCSQKANSTTNFLAEALQSGVSVQVTF